MKLNRRILICLLLSTLLGALLFLYLHYAITRSVELQPAAIKRLFISLIFANLAGLGIFYCSRFLNRKAPWHISPSLRFLVELVVLGLFAFLLCYGALKLYFSWQDIVPKAFYRQYHDPVLKFIILSVVIIFIYTIIDFTLYSYRQYAALQIESVKVTSTQLALQLETLKSQLSPHYLFNSLNTISELVYSNPAQAEQFIRKLAQTYQYILQTQDKKLVPLSAEIDFVKAYFFLLKARFADAVQLSLDLPRRVLSSTIPPLTLQLLLENAVKHNVPSDENPLLVRIFVSDSDELTVSNNIVSSGQKLVSFQVGLDNIRQRYQYFAQRTISVTQAADFTVALPLLYLHTQPA